MRSGLYVCLHTWDGRQHRLDGTSVFLKSLSFCVPSEDDYAIYHDSQQTGIMHVKVEPCKPDGGVINDEDVAGSLVTAARPVRTASPLRHVVTTGGGPSGSPFWRTPEESCAGLGSVSLKIKPID